MSLVSNTVVFPSRTSSRCIRATRFHFLRNSPQLLNAFSAALATTKQHNNRALAAGSVARR